ncbi:MAG: right-handed parallel beta-helix repeat-containing protein [Candidatus Cloacimonetes bacterium]|nr:right-handed parallel beta-helix repeat-containing protein [Candidatus Cloacimonadota bacterium]MCF7815316.1 right-handed parallel beta-helix repeat-containing protein [Candidatus Cloacimonadota bacterium]MCF7869430.1 right-handed parallel beta-helix repeat-containing protein [Candidatus Cloacimonadota bacterium]MCF7884823.1 right-handed parallel beta-helix repeat-containing protein [Candidatus Cloacimonadota bacterium]
MKRLIIYFLLSGAICLQALSLKEVYESAPANAGFDRYLELETGQIYTGGLLIGNIFNPITTELEGDEGADVKIVGNGAILDLQGEQICISYCDNILEIDNCIIINGNIRYRGINLSYNLIEPTGYVEYCTFYNTHDYGIRIFGAGDGIRIERNIFVDAIETGDDFTYLNGNPMEWLPTGANVAISIFYTTYGVPDLIDNWSFHNDTGINSDPLKHFVQLCEYG